ncbi:MAG: HpcH/HpaI aldolase/citrate lyase family protein [Rhizomicrobium sp.]
MRLRSLLFVPADRAERLAKARGAGADAVILDLEDSVTLERKGEARRMAAEFLSHPRALPVFVRVNGPSLAEDLAAVISAKPSGIVLPKAAGAGAVIALDRSLTALGDSQCLILPIVTETPAAIFALGGYAGVSPRLCAMTWGVEDLSAAIGAGPRNEDGRYSFPFETVRALMLFAAHAAKVPALETVYPAFKDGDGLRAYAGRGWRDGFSGMLAVHPSQVAIINQSFMPSLQDVEWAKRVVDAFTAQPGAGTLQAGGEMLDAPHLARAKRILTGLDH